MNFGDPRLPDRFWSKVAPCPMSGCWLWIAATVNGYGKTGGGPRGDRWNARAHRYSYVALVGDVPVGLDLDHLCRVRCCVNPAHLEPVTRAVNMARSPLTPHMRKFATHCKRGHEMTAENTGGLDKRQRYCRACERLRYQSTYAQRAAVRRANAAHEEWLQRHRLRPISPELAAYADAIMREFGREVAA